jgi:hypothetical protein
MKASETITEPLSLKALLDEPVRHARRHLRALYLPFAVPLTILAGAQPVVQYSLAPMTTASLGGTSLLTQMGITYAILFALLMAYDLAFVAMVVAATDVLAGGTGAPGRAWLRALDPRLLLTEILAWIAILGGLIFCILPGIYVGLILTSSVPVMAHERRFGLAALKRSVELMSRNPLRKLSLDPRARAFLLRVSAGLLAYALPLIVQLPFTVVMMIIMFSSALSGAQPDPQAVMAKLVWLQVPMAMLGMLIHTFVFLYLAFGIALLYFDARRRKEGDDLVSAADNLARRTGPGL